VAVSLYILHCADGRYYVGTTRSSLEKRVAEHNAGTFDGYTKWRRPVRLVFYEVFENAVDAIVMERRLKGWSRAKKEALIRGDFEALKRLAKPGSKRAGTSFDKRAALAAQDEGTC
jgi:putative endonuclease